MGWLLGLFGAVFALALSDAEPVAGVLGFASGWLLGALLRQRGELESLHQRVTRIESELVDAPQVEPRPPVRPAEVSPEPVAVYTPPRAAVRPAPPPAWEVKLRALAARWLTEGNVPVKVGVVVLLVGVAAALRYAAQRGIFSLPIEVRLASVALASMAGLAFGWRERERRRAFGLSVQGGAVGTLLLTVFAAFRLYAVLPAGLAFGLSLAIVVGAAALAVLQDALALAVLGTAGGFLAPVLISRGGGSHVALFSYYLLLNAGVVAMVWLRGWRPLSLVGFAFTFVISAAWGYRYYRPEYLATTEPLLIAFFLCYVGLAVLHSVRRGAVERDAVDVALVFGVPLCAFPLQAALLEDRALALAFSSLAVALLYAALGAWALRRRDVVTLGLSFVALAIGFSALAVPLALSARWTACAWVVQGAALVWLGLRGRRALACYFGALLQAFAVAAYVGSILEESPARAILNGDFLAGVLTSGAVLFSAYRFERSGEWPGFGMTAFSVGGLVWALGAAHETTRFSSDLEPAAWVAFLALTLALCAALRERLPWPRMSAPITAALGVAWVSAFATWPKGGLPNLGWLSWPLALGVGLYALRTLDSPRARSIAFAHCAWLATLATLLGSELQMRSAELLDGSAWPATLAALPLALLLGATWRREPVAAFPLAAAFLEYRAYWFALASLALGGWWLWSLGQDGDPAPLGFVPVLNPLELLQLASVLLVYGVWNEQAGPRGRTEVASAALAAGFVGLSFFTLRGVHHWGGVPWEPELIESNLAQTSLSVIWTALCVAAWIFGSRRGSRPVWFAGAVLMGLVLAKLVLVDRRYMGDLPGIVSFVVVGLLLLVVGYLAPSPPRASAAEHGG